MQGLQPFWAQGQIWLRTPNVCSAQQAALNCKIATGSSRRRDDRETEVTTLRNSKPARKARMA